MVIIRTIRFTHSWDDSTYSYPSPIRKGTNVSDHSVIYRKYNSVEWMSEEQKKMLVAKT